MTTKELTQQTRLLMAKHPELKETFMSLYELAITEIQEGGNESVECERALEDMNEEIREYLNS